MLSATALRCKAHAAQLGDEVRPAGGKAHTVDLWLAALERAATRAGCAPQPVGSNAALTAMLRSCEDTRAVVRAWHTMLVGPGVGGGNSVMEEA